jgi:flavin reductase (DIM6/NTAB) family NADH-FMN oxidoreductase RutF
VQPDAASYELLRYLTSPVVAITTSAAGRRNGCICNSAQRASLVPSIQRLSVYLSRGNLTHDLVFASGVFGLHLLRRDQWDVIWSLGLVSGRDGDKFDGIALRTGATGCPLLVDARATYECRVINAMDAGAATFFLGEVVDVVLGASTDVMTSDYFRTHIPDDKKRIYEANLKRAQQVLEPLSRTVRPAGWPGPSTAP